MRDFLTARFRSYRAGDRFRGQQFSQTDPDRAAGVGRPPCAGDKVHSATRASFAR